MHSYLPPKNRIKLEGRYKSLFEEDIMVFISLEKGGYSTLEEIFKRYGCSEKLSLKIQDMLNTGKIFLIPINDQKQSHIVKIFCPLEGVWETLDIPCFYCQWIHSCGFGTEISFINCMDLNMWLEDTGELPNVLDSADYKIIPNK